MSPEPALPRVLVIGLDPHRFTGPWDPTPIVRGLEASAAKFREHGVEEVSCLVGPEDPLQEVESALAQGPFDCVVVGGGIRKDPSLFALFEDVVNLVHTRAPGAVIAFNDTPSDVWEAASRRLVDGG